MNQEFQTIAQQACNAEAIFPIEEIQSLWSGYGKIVRYGLRGGCCDSVVIKHVQLPDRAHHPRGWATDRSHQRKVRSYHVESHWYRDYAARCDEHCRIPGCYALKEGEEEFLMVFEDLDAAGYSARLHSAGLGEMHACLAWLAGFHATFMGVAPEGLWPIGTYWHLDTRPDELAALADGELKAAASAIDGRLNGARYQTLVHGDAKLANFCFDEGGERVAAVDFQYVGGGCGMKDLAYFIGSCLHEAECERYEQALLDDYFSLLRAALVRRAVAVDPDAVEQEWRALYPWAWSDFHRFLKGWSPGHWKVNDYSERLARQVCAELREGA